jgi:hypothetical protein
MCSEALANPMLETKKKRKNKKENENKEGKKNSIYD